MYNTEEFRTHYENLTRGERARNLFILLMETLQVKPDQKDISIPKLMQETIEKEDAAHIFMAKAQMGNQKRLKLKPTRKPKTDKGTEVTEPENQADTELVSVSN